MKPKGLYREYSRYCCNSYVRCQAGTENIGGHSVKYIIVEPLCCTPETHSINTECQLQLRNKIKNRKQLFLFQLCHLITLKIVHL